MLAVTSLWAAILIGLFSVTPEDHTSRGLRYLSYYDFQSALREFEAARGLLPTSEVALVNVALAHYYLGSFEQARTHLKSALQESPDSPYALFVMGVLEKVTNRRDEAKRLFSSVIKIDPEDFAAYYQLGLIELAAGDFSEAVSLFEKAIELNPECASAVYNLARALLRSGQMEEGKVQLEIFKKLHASQEGPARGGMGEPTLLKGKYGQPRTSDPN